MVDLKHIVTIRWWSDGGTCTTVQHISGRKTNHSKLTRPFSTQMGSKPLIVLYIYIHLSIWWYSVSFFHMHENPALKTDKTDFGSEMEMMVATEPFIVTLNIICLEVQKSFLHLNLHWDCSGRNCVSQAEWSLLDVVSQDANRWRAVESIAKS